MSDEGDDSSSPTENKPRRAALVFLFITVLLDMLALGMIGSVLRSCRITSSRAETAPWCFVW